LLILNEKFFEEKKLSFIV
jgi:hypothetical protein